MQRIRQRQQILLRVFREHVGSQLDQTRRAIRLAFIKFLTARWRLRARSVGLSARRPWICVRSHPSALVGLLSHGGDLLLSSGLSKVVNRLSREGCQYASTILLFRRPALPQAMYNVQHALGYSAPAPLPQSVTLYRFAVALCHLG